MHMKSVTYMISFMSIFLGMTQLINDGFMEFDMIHHLYISNMEGLMVRISISMAPVQHGIREFIV